MARPRAQASNGRRGDIAAPDAEKGQNPAALQSVTETVPHEADSTSAPNMLPDDVNRPPVSTNKPDVPIAHSLVAGAGAPAPGARSITQSSARTRRPTTAQPKRPRRPASKWWRKTSR